MYQIVKVTPNENLVVTVQFSDGYTATFNVKEFIKEGISKELLDENVFKNVKVDEFGGISWVNGFDFCPNFLREHL